MIAVPAVVVYVFHTLVRLVSVSRPNLWSAGLRRLSIIREARVVDNLKHGGV